MGRIGLYSLCFFPDTKGSASGLCQPFKKGWILNSFPSLRKPAGICAQTLCASVDSPGVLSCVYPIGWLCKPDWGKPNPTIFSVRVLYFVGDEFAIIVGL